jgi:hypothetical protein
LYYISKNDNNFNNLKIMKNANVKLSLMIMGVAFFIAILGIYISNSEALTASHLGTYPANDLLVGGGGVLAVDGATYGLIVHSGNVGIGTDYPVSTLSVGGSGVYGASIYSAGGYYGVYSVGSTYGVLASGSTYDFYGNGDSRFNGNVTIGRSLNLYYNTVPLNVPVMSKPSRPSGCTSGMIIYDTTNAEFEGCQGGVWWNFWMHSQV